MLKWRIQLPREFETPDTDSTEKEGRIWTEKTPEKRQEQLEKHKISNRWRESETPEKRCATEIRSAKAYWERIL